MSERIPLLPVFLIWRCDAYRGSLIDHNETAYKTALQALQGGQAFKITYFVNKHCVFRER